MSKNPLDALPGNLGNHLGEYLREQRLLAKLSVRQLSALAGVSNPYLSQIERGVKRPSADILQQIAKGLSISAETLYVQAGLLDPKDAGAEAGDNTRSAIRSDPALTARQRQTLLEIYESFVGADRGRTKDSTPKGSASSSSATRTTSSRSDAKQATKTTAKKKTTAKTSATPKASASRAASTQGGGTSSSARTKGSPKASGSKNSKSTPRRNP
ncbi:helix-turn-helix domain-containing protein [Janibacter cremeus]|uniref:Transcriptional regulator with XRE-family HTH domain n=1 Tax=Janibacter cremeus TaxID=1285192 RepID=A0A852VR87_9MICO|nr:helix-turn-helix transcriptional regulator [Janibacter cremeus]NYF97950.1 transcriptional regulator with XRE-family HTH domain [Janibacter cremeus]